MRQLNIDDNTGDHLDGDGCFGARIRYAWIKVSAWFTRQNYQALFTFDYDLYIILRV